MHFLSFFILLFHFVSFSPLHYYLPFLIHTDQSYSHKSTFTASFVVLFSLICFFLQSLIIFIIVSFLFAIFVLFVDDVAIHHPVGVAAAAAVVVFFFSSSLLSHSFLRLLLRLLLFHRF